MYAFVLIKEATIITNQPQKLKEFQDQERVYTFHLHDHGAAVGRDGGCQTWGRMLASGWWSAGGQEWQVVAEKQPTCAVLLLRAAPNRGETEQQ